MGNTTSLSIKPPVTGEVAPSSTPTGEVVLESTSNGGVRVVEVKETPPVVTPSTEGLILGKFKTQADLEAAYKALESGVGKQKEGTQTESQTAPTSLSITDATKALTDKGLDYVQFAKEYAEKGALSSESYQALFAKGVTAQDVDRFIAGQAPLIAAQKAVQEASTKEILDHVGGADEFAKLTDFASKAITPEELASYNRAIEAGDKIAAKILLTNFKAQMEKSLGKEPNLNGGTPPSVGSQDVYQTLDQYHADLAKSEYRNDAYFRNKVDSKLERSKSLYATA